MEKIDQILESLFNRVIEPVEAKEQLLLLFGVGECSHPSTYWYWQDEARTIKHCAWCGAKNIR